MANHKRKKKKEKPFGWTSSGRLHKHERIDEQSERNLHNRSKSKKVIIFAKVKPNKPRWFHPEGWFVWSKYEKLSDAEKAIIVLRKKKYTGDSYDFKIGE